MVVISYCHAADTTSITCSYGHVFDPYIFTPTYKYFYNGKGFTEKKSYLNYRSKVIGIKSILFQKRNFKLAKYKKTIIPVRPKQPNNFSVIQRFKETI